MNPQPRARRHLALVGCGAIGGAVLELLRDDPAVSVTQVIVPVRSAAAARDLCADRNPAARVLAALDLQSGRRPDLLVECAGHAAVAQHVLPALRAGIPAVVASIGSLHDAGLLAELGDAAAQGATQVQLVAGAIGAIDALAAARIGGLSSVQYIGRKPPSGWRGTPAEAVCDLAHLTEAAQIFEGTAREAARLYPKNANVAATVSLAGLGFDETRTSLIADPGVSRNVHRIVAEGAFGRLDLTLENKPLRANPKTSALTVYSIVRAIHNATRAIAI
jgi:aspartate dehydrogenase